MSDWSDIAYTYDGSFEGLLCCVFESYSNKEIPSKILSYEGQYGLFDFQKWIETDAQKAQRVYDSIPVKISREAQNLVKLGFLTANPQKEILILRFLRFGYKVGGSVMSMLTDDTVNSLQKAVHNLTQESHRYKGFIRFSIYQETLVAVIEPRNFVLPLLAAHFSNRFRNETFMIYDKNHKVALVHQGGKVEIVEVEHLELPELEEKEAEYRHLWQLYHKTIGIEGRYNPKCRMNFMPKRFWSQLTEFYSENEYAAKRLITGQNDKTNSKSLETH